MDNYIFSVNGDQVGLGDSIKVTPEVLEVLKKVGLVKKAKSTPTDLTFYASKVANRLGWDSLRTANEDPFWRNLNIREFGPFLDMLTREIALELDKKYPDHIKECEEVYVISRLDFTIGKIKTSDIKFSGYVPLFRTEEDAKFAVSILTGVKGYNVS